MSSLGLLAGSGVGIRVEHGSVARVMSGGDEVEVRFRLGLAIIRLGRADLGIEPLGWNAGMLVYIGRGIGIGIGIDVYACNATRLPRKVYVV